MPHTQAPFDIKLEWGIRGVEALAAVSDVIVIVDVLSFSTCVDIAAGNGAIVYPYRWKDESAVEYARSLGAELADFTRRDTGVYSLSPTSLLNIHPGTRLVLPSPNGSALSLATKTIPTLCGCLRNARAVAAFAAGFGKKVSIIPAGEQWADGTLRPALEDVAGAGAIISHLKGIPSPESKAAARVYQHAKAHLLQEISASSSGRELIERGFTKDIHLACDLDASNHVPLLVNGSYIDRKSAVAGNIKPV